MANVGLSSVEKRELLNQPVASVDALLRWGRTFEEEGLVHDAVDFYEKAQAKEPLEALLDVAREDGDLFLFGRICRILKRDPSGDEWLALAKQAEALGKLRFATEAYRRAGVTQTAAPGGEPPAA